MLLSCSPLHWGRRTTFFVASSGKSGTTRTHRKFQWHFLFQTATIVNVLLYRKIDSPSPNVLPRYNAKDLSSHRNSTGFSVIIEAIPYRTAHFMLRQYILVHSCSLSTTSIQSLSTIDCLFFSLKVKTLLSLKFLKFCRAS